MKTEEYLKPIQVSEKFKVGLKTVYRLVASGRLPSVKMGRSVRIRKSDVEAYIFKGRTRNKDLEELNAAIDIAKSFVECSKGHKDRNQFDFKAATLVARKFLELYGELSFLEE